MVAALTILLSLAVAALLVIAACLYLLTFDHGRRLHLLASRLLAEQQVENATRATLKAMVQAVRKDMPGEEVP